MTARPGMLLVAGRGGDENDTAVDPSKVVSIFERFGLPERLN